MSAEILSTEIPSGNILSEVLYEYDEQNRVRRITHLHPADSGVVFIFDDDGHLTATDNPADRDSAESDKEAEPPRSEGDASGIDKADDT